MTHTDRARRVNRWSRPLPVLVVVGMLTAAVAAGAAPDVTLQPIVTGLPRPVVITHAGDGSGRLFIVRQAGVIRIWDGTSLLPTPFLDIDSLVSCCGERGLLGLAFHPEYETNGHFFVNYTDNGGDTVVARYTVSADPDVADPGSAVVVLNQNQPFGNHNGGELAFGPDGRLYIGLGDGGDADDPLNSGQNMLTWLGKILRIDVDALPYTVPVDNPFVGDLDALDEIWASGLRNPWRFSFDRANGDLLISDVGQGAWEEIDLQPASSGGGEDYGWRLMEGSSCFNPPMGCNDGTLTLPILEYAHAGGRCSVIGGYVSRLGTFSALYGHYVFGDYCTGEIWGATPGGGGAWASIPLANIGSTFSLTTFGEGEDGVLYVGELDGNGRVYRVVDASEQGLVFADNFEGGGTAAWSTTVAEADEQLTPIPVSFPVSLEGGPQLQP